MDIPKPKIRFYKVRTFSEKISVSFDFIRENLRLLLKFSFFLILPLCLVQSFFLNAYMQSYFALLGNGSTGMVANISSVFLSYGLMSVCMLVGNILLSAMLFGLIQTYERRTTRLTGLTLSEFKPLLLQNCAKAARIVFFFLGISMLAFGILALLALLSLWTLLVTIPLLLVAMCVFMTPCSLMTPIYLFEDRPFMPALNKAIKYGFAAWGEIFLVLLVFGLLSSIISGVTTIPWYLLTLISAFFSMNDPEASLNTALWHQLLSWLLGIIQSYGTYLASILVSTGIAFQYFHLREKREGITMQADISNFDRL
ncbi:MAG: hypothetical protein LBD27_06020 [Tannerella sp.]|jgi:hypothetical protein|nr:hypothetical protein [Tannerella sp.]